MVQTSQLEAYRSSDGSALGGLVVERINMDHVMQGDGRESLVNYTHGYDSSAADPYFKLRNKSASQTGYNFVAATPVDPRR